MRAVDERYYIVGVIVIVKATRSHGERRDRAVFAALPFESRPAHRAASINPPGFAADEALFRLGVLRELFSFR